MMAISKKEQLSINRAIGESFEEACLKDLKWNGFTFSRQVIIYYKPDKFVKADTVAYKGGVAQMIIEMKSSSTATFTANQKEGYPIISKQGGILEDQSVFPAVPVIVMYPDATDSSKIKRVSL